MGACLFSAETLDLFTMMNNKKIFFVFLCVLFFPFAGHAAQKIDSFDAGMRVNRDGTVVAQEKIIFEASNAKESEFVRTIPLRYSFGDSKYSISISQINVVNEKNEQVKFEVGGDSDNRVITMTSGTISKPTKVLYLISYLVEGALSFRSDHDELNWRVIPNQSHATIGPISAGVSFLNDMDIRDIKVICTIEGTAAHSCAHKLARSQGGGRTDGILVSNENVKSDESVFLSVSFPKGIVRQPTTLEGWFSFLKEKKVWVYSVVAVLLVVGLIVWRAITPLKKEIAPPV